MLSRIIHFSINNKFIILLLVSFLVGFRLVFPEQNLYWSRPGHHK